MTSATFCNVSIIFLCQWLYFGLFYISAKFYWQQTSITRDIEGGLNQPPPQRSWGAPQKLGPYRVKESLQNRNFWAIFAKYFFPFLVKLHALKRIIWSSNFGVWIRVTGMSSIVSLLTIMFFINFLPNLCSARHSNPHLWPPPFLP